MSISYKDLQKLYNIPKQNKYRNIKVKTSDGVFDSQKELTRYYELKLLERAGEITALERQKDFTLIDKSRWGRKIVYRADFVYYKDNQLVVEDTKSVITKQMPLFKLKARLFAERYGFEIKIVE